MIFDKQRETYIVMNGTEQEGIIEYNNDDKWIFVPDEERYLTISEIREILLFMDSLI